MLEDYPEVLTISEVAEILRVAPLTLKRWEKRGRITSIRINARGDRRDTKGPVRALVGQDSQKLSCNWSNLLQMGDIVKAF